MQADNPRCQNLTTWPISLGLERSETLPITRQYDGVDSQDGDRKNAVQARLIHSLIAGKNNEEPGEPVFGGAA